MKKESVAKGITQPWGTALVGDPRRREETFALSGDVAAKRTRVLRPLLKEQHIVQSEVLVDITGVSTCALMRCRLVRTTLIVD